VFSKIGPGQVRARRGRADPKAEVIMKKIVIVLGAVPRVRGHGQGRGQRVIVDKRSNREGTRGARKSKSMGGW
jgi:hypothetical protein